MNLGTEILTAIFIAICFAPFAVMAISRKKKAKNILHSLTDLAAEHNCKITRRELCGELAIGLAENENAILYYKPSDDKVIEKYINLSDIKTCRIVNSNHTVNNKGRNDKVIDKLVLSFLPFASNKPEILLPIYNSTENPQLTGEFQFIEKWAGIINNHLASLKNKEAPILVKGQPG